MNEKLRPRPHPRSKPEKSHKEKEHDKRNDFEDNRNDLGDKRNDLGDKRNDLGDKRDELGYREKKESEMGKKQNITEEAREKYWKEDTYHYKLDTKLADLDLKKCSNFLEFKKTVYKIPGLGNAINMFRGKYNKDVIDAEQNKFSHEFISFVKNGVRNNPKLQYKLLYLIDEANEGNEISEYIEQKKKQHGITSKILAESCFFVAEQIPDEFKKELEDDYRKTSVDENPIKESIKNTEKEDPKREIDKELENETVVFNVELVSHQMSSKSSRENWFTIAEKPQTEIPINIKNEMVEHDERFGNVEGDHSDLEEPIPGKTLVVDVKTTGSNDRIMMRLSK